MIKSLRNRLEKTILRGLRRSFWMLEEQWEKEIRKERAVFREPIVIWDSPLRTAQDSYEEVQRLNRTFQDICIELNSSKSFLSSRLLKALSFL